MWDIHGVHAMPSSEYFGRQVDICLRLSVIASDDEVASQLIAMAHAYRAKAEALERRSTRPTRGVINRTESSPLPNRYWLKVSVPS
jgi:hypothetical protein